VTPKAVMNFIITITNLTSQPQAFQLRIICRVFSYFRSSLWCVLLQDASSWTRHALICSSSQIPILKYLKEMLTVTPIYGIIIRSNNRLNGKLLATLIFLCFS